MKNTLLIALFAAALFISGCSTLPKSDLTALQGKWKGRVIQGDSVHPCTFVISGSNFQFRDEAEANVWYKGTFTLREDTTPRRYIAAITDCSFPQYVGKTGTAIYRIENSTLTITANEPGNPAVPLTFDAPDAARIEVKKE
jgi:uncharacterized protein (TIGR03067 family)